jgi:hypothetical protein
MKHWYEGKDWKEVNIKKKSENCAVSVVVDELVILTNPIIAVICSEILAHQISPLHLS